jgi:AAA+ superfamily predicted ATPase
MMNPRRIPIGRRDRRDEAQPAARPPEPGRAVPEATPSDHVISTQPPPPQRAQRGPRRSLRVMAATADELLRRYARAACRHARALVQGKAAELDGILLDAQVPFVDGCDRLKLAAREREGLIILAALELDPGLRALAKDSGVETITTASLLHLLHIPDSDVDLFRRRFGSDGELVAAGFIEHTLDGRLTASTRLFGLFDGVIAFDPTLREVASFVLCPVTPGDDSDKSDKLTLAASGLLIGQPLLVTGPKGAGRTRFVAAAAQKAGFSGLLLVDAPLVKDAAFWPRLHHEATLLNAVLVLQFIDELGATQLRLERLAIGPRIQVAHPSRGERRTLWREELARRGLTLSDPPLARLAEAYQLGPSGIEATVELALAQAKLSGTLTLAMLEKAAKARSPDALGRFAKKIDARAGLEGLVVSPELREEIDELLVAARHRNGLAELLRVAEAGLVALFSGPPGCGKTHAASAIAHELGRPLYRIDVSTIVDRFLGETEKHLAQLFAEAACSNGVLLFDEADSLFSRRVAVKDAQDRYANMQVNTLLNLIDDYKGFVILTTNLSGSIDGAFSRRIPYKLHFPKPDVAERLALWRQLMPPGLPLSSEVDLDGLAREFELSGALIKNAIWRAASVTVPGGAVGDATLRHAIHRELASDGRVVASQRLQRET